MKKVFLTSIISLVTLLGNAQNFIGVPGIYVNGAADQPLSTSYYSKPFVDGGAIRMFWETIEPSPGVYDFSFIDGEIATAASFGKKIGIAILKHPVWMVDSLGAEGVSFIDQNPSHPTFGDTLFTPLKYDPVVVTRYKLLMDELALHYANDTNVTYFHIFSGLSNDLPQAVADGTPFYQTHVYNPDTLISRLKDLTHHYMALFPTTPLWNSPDIVGFEPQATGLSKIYVADSIMSWGVSTYPNRFGVWREDLSSCVDLVNPHPSIHWTVLIKYNCRTGSQMVWNVQEGPFKMNKCFNAPQDFSASSKAIVMDSSLNNGLSINMQFFEVYKVDILDPDLDSVLTNFHTKLFNQIQQNCNVTTAVNENLKMHEPDIYPNPSSGIFTIEQEEIFNKIQIFNINGQVVFTTQILSANVTTINLSETPNGIYFIKVFSGNSVNVQKIIKN